MTSLRNPLGRVLAGAALVASIVPLLGAAETGLIGKRHAGPDITYDHFSGSTVDKAFGAAAEANLPLTSTLDLNFGYAYSDASGDNYDALEKRLKAAIVFHRATEYGTAYFAPMLGHSWRSADVLGVGSRDNSAFWGARAGYEIPLGRKTALNLGLGYTDSFERRHVNAQELRYAVEANHWFSGDLAGVTALTYRQIKAAPDAIAYTLGLRWAF